jgi:hypothetical protein
MQDDEPYLGFVNLQVRFHNFEKKDYSGFVCTGTYVLICFRPSSFLLDVNSRFCSCIGILLVIVKGITPAHLLRMIKLRMSGRFPLG